MTRVVRCSARPGSGWACRSRRNATSPDPRAARNSSRLRRTLPSMTAIPAEDEAVLSELGDKRVYHASQVGISGVRGPLPFARGAVLKHLGRDRELLNTAEPPCYR